MPQKVLAPDGGASYKILPELGPNLRTFVVNLKRRADRRRHIEDVCSQLGLQPEVVDAVDGLALAAGRGASYECIGSASGKAGSKSTSARKTQPTAVKKPQGFKGLENNVYALKYRDQDGKQCRHLLRMAAHRLMETEYTRAGHELWGALGCSLSHQKIMERILTESIEFALILEDDASLPVDAENIKKAYSAGRDYISKERQQWNLIYLGGHISTTIKATEKTQWRISPELLQCKCIYQTHAYIIHRRIIPDVLRRMRQGMAADAALVSWSRDTERLKRTEYLDGDVLMFSPPLLLQPGGPARRKDSDIFVEGEAFKAQKATEEPYAFKELGYGRIALWKSYLKGEKGLAEDVATTDPYLIFDDEDDEVEMDEAWMTSLLGDLEHDLGSFAEETKQEVLMSEAALRAARAKVGDGWLESVAKAAYWLVHDHRDPSEFNRDALRERQRLSRLLAVEMRIQLPHEQAMINACIPALVKLPGDRSRFDITTCLCILHRLAQVLGKEITSGSPELLDRPEAQVIFEIDGMIREHTEHLEAVCSTQKACATTPAASLDSATFTTCSDAKVDAGHNEPRKNPTRSCESKSGPRKRKQSKDAGKSKKQRAKEEQNKRKAELEAMKVSELRRRALYVGVPKSHINCMLEKNDVVQAILAHTKNGSGT
mmetsp:Transcript_19393/g.45106  ORF Transcript_19393/g.45106 Transcript_19393/m.45106 type:complete len:660 (-) Transcript_19393:83-2062(-)